MFAARQIANNLSSIAKKWYLHFLAVRIISEVESRTQGSRSRPKPQKKKSEAKESPPRTNPLEAKDTGASVLKTKNSSKKFLRQSPEKTFPKKFSGDQQNFNNSINTAVLEPRTGQFSRK